MLCTSLIAFAGIGAAMVPEENSGRARVAPHETAAPIQFKGDKCRSARAALRWYRGWEQHWLRKMGAGVAVRVRIEPRAACPRYLAKVVRAKARAARVAYVAWHTYHWAWWEWMPREWQNRSRCELGYSLQPRSWRSNVTNYVGRFHGFVNFYYPSSWDGYKIHANPKAGPYPEDAIDATPRQQYEVALAIEHRVGLGAWNSCA